MNESDFVALTQELLNSIASGDYETYQRLCATDLTCFEPECEGYLVQGLPFHKFFFDLPPSRDKRKAPPATVTMSSVHVRRLGETAAVISYIRINQLVSVDKDGSMIDGPKITKSCETRVWENVNGVWKNVHMHRS